MLLLLGLHNSKRGVLVGDYVVLVFRVQRLVVRRDVNI